LSRVEHALDVRQRLADFAIDDAEKVERDVELDQEGVDQHQVADGHPAVDDAAGGAPHHRRDAERDDQLLAEVERRQRRLAARRGVFPLEHVLVVAPRLVGFVVEVLDRLVVEQAVDRPRVGGRIGFIHGAPDIDAPVADLHREHDVGDQRDGGDQHEAEVVLDEENPEHESHFDERRQDRVERVGDQAGNRPGAALDVARDAAGLTFQVKAQAQRVQVAEDLERHLADGALGDAGEKEFAKFGKQRGRKAEGAVENEQHHRQRQYLVGQREPVDQLLEDDGNADIGDLGPDEAGERDQHAETIGPEIGEEEAQRLPDVNVGHGPAGRRLGEGACATHVGVP
jgi:hypothetical protein